MRASAPHPAWVRLLGTGLLLFCALGFQARLSGPASLWGGQPDFLLTLSLSIAMLADASTATWVGFGGGVLTAGMAGETVGTYLVTRTLAGFLAATLRKRFVRQGVLVGTVGVGIASLFVGVLYGLSVPRIGLSRWLATTLIGAAWNTLLALPLLALLRWLGWGR